MRESKQKDKQPRLNRKFTPVLPLYGYVHNRNFAKNILVMDNPFDLILNRLDTIQDKVGEIGTILQLAPQLPEPAKDSLLNIKQAAELLGLSVPTLYSKVSKAEIPVSKQGNRLYFSKQELTNWIKTGRKKTIAETQVGAETYLQTKNKGGQHGTN